MSDYPPKPKNWARGLGNGSGDLRCCHCGERIYPTGRQYAHEYRHERACIIASHYTGHQAHPPGVPCADDCAGHQEAS